MNTYELVQVNIDLIQQAAKITDLKSSNDVVEKVLREFIAAQNLLNKPTTRHLGEAKGLIKIADDFDEMLEISELESPDAPSIYKGHPLTLEEMEQAIDYEAGQRK